MRTIEKIRQTIEAAKHDSTCFVQLLEDASEMVATLERIVPETQQLGPREVLRVPCFLVGLASGRSELRLLTDAECSEIRIPIDGDDDDATELNRVAGLGLLKKRVVLVLENPATNEPGSG